MSKAKRKITRVRKPPLKPPQENPGRLLLYCVLIAVVTIIAFYPSLGNGFTNWDDPDYVTDNPDIRLQNPGDLGRLVTSVYSANYHPLTMLCYAAEFKCFGLDPAPYHYVNLILHCINALLVFLLIFRLWGSAGAALATALLFAVHPLRVESVAWIAELKDVLFSLFYFLSLLAYLSYLKNKGWKAYAACLAALVLSLMSKPMAVSLPLALVLVDYLKNRNINAKSLLEKAPFFALAGVFALKAYLSQNATGAIHHYAMLSGVQRLCVPFYGMLFYLVKTLLPLRLSALYGYASAGDSFMRVLMYAAPFAAIGLAAVVFFTRRAGRVAVFGSLFFLVTLLPVLQIVTIGDAIVAERYTYLPMIGVYFMIGAGIRRLLTTRLRNSPGGRAALLAALGAVILAFAFMTNARCKVWKDSLTLWDNVIGQFPGLSVPHNMCGNEYRRMGSYEQALAEFGRAIACNPAASEAYYNRGTVYNDNFGKYDLAIADFSASIRLNPNSAAAYNNRGTAYFAKGISDTALENFAKAISLKPDYAEAYVNRGLALYRLRRYGDAIGEFSRALRCDPGLAEAYNSRGASRAAEGDLDGAAADFRKALQLRPDYPAAKRNLAFAQKRSNGR